MMLSRSLVVTTLIASLTCFISTGTGKDVAPPPNAGAKASWDAAKGELVVEYHGAEILRATVTAKDSEEMSLAVKLDSKTDATDERVEQTLTLTPVEAKEGASGTVSGRLARPSAAAKSEIRISKSERSTNDRKSNVQNQAHSVAAAVVLFGIFGFCVLNLFRISIFGLRISRTLRKF